MVLEGQVPIRVEPGIVGAVVLGVKLLQTLPAEPRDHFRQAARADTVSVAGQKGVHQLRVEQALRVGVRPFHFVEHHA